MNKTVRNALICWGIITLTIIGESLWIFSRHGLDGFPAFMQEAPYTNLPITLASVALTWFLVGFILWQVLQGRLTRTGMISWVGFALVSFSYLNILRERVRYGDIDYYLQAASSLVNRQPMPDSYLYPPLWATLLSFLSPLGDGGILLVCWIANVLSLLLFFLLLHRVLERYGFNPQAAGLVTTAFLLVNMPVLRTLMYVQVNLHVMNLIILSLLFFNPRPALSAFTLALAVHLKASPALLLLAFLLEFNWKWLMWFVLSILLLAGITMAPYGIQPFLDFVNNFFLLNGPHTLSMRDNSFDSAIGITLAYFRADASLVRILVYLGKGISVFTGIILCLRIRGSCPENKRGARLNNSILPLLLAMTLASPLIWEHHGVFITLPFLWLIKKLETPLEWTLLGAVYLFEFLTPTFDYYPWSYSRLLGILLLLVFLWITQKRKDNAVFPAFNVWAKSLIPINHQT